MERKKSYRNIVFDFTHCYTDDHDSELVWIDCSDITGCRLFCDKQAQDRLHNMIRKQGVSGIHFIDSGDYHYITKLMTDELQEPFTLILIDHHTDLQGSKIGDLLSCGNWAGKVLAENQYLNKLVLIGQEHEKLVKLNHLNKEKLIGISYEELKQGVVINKLNLIKKDIPVYISVDKDVLNEKYAVTNWDQGEMSMYTLEHLLKYLVLDYEIIGIDICGEYDEEQNIPKFLKAERINNKSDKELYFYLEKLFQSKQEILISR